MAAMRAGLPSSHRARHGPDQGQRLQPLRFVDMRTSQRLLSLSVALLAGCAMVEQLRPSKGVQSFPSGTQTSSILLKEEPT